MIDLRCSNCGEVQQLDRAFAGGVCRCRACAAIQTVPAEDEAGGIGSGSTLLYCPEGARPVRRGRADFMSPQRMLMLGICLAAVMFLAAAGAMIALLDTADEPVPAAKVR